jgi:hypothetical protein
MLGVMVGGEELALWLARVRARARLHWWQDLYFSVVTVDGQAILDVRLARRWVVFVRRASYGHGDRQCAGTASHLSCFCVRQM